MIQNIQMPPAAPALPWPVVWAPVISGVAVLIVGVIAATIAYRQWRTARTKVQLDLFEKRAPIYDACREFVLRFVWSGTPNNEQLAAFYEATERAGFLFDNVVKAYVDDLRNTASDMISLEQLAAGLYEEELRRVAWEEVTLRFEWFKAQPAVIEKLFTPFLRLEERGNRSSVYRLKKPAAPPRIS